MCGIIGVINTLQAPFQKGLKGIEHRGPDASGIFESENLRLQLGHTRLAIIDLKEASNQPFYSGDSRYVLVYNGELYNYRDLANKHALSLRTNSDTEVIVELYAKLGTAFLSELNGMFAGAIYDTATDVLFLFRDRLGIKPLYYFDNGEQFAFSSELPALLEMIPKPGVNQQSVADFLHLGYIPEPNTLYENVFKFPSGSYAEYKDGKLKINSFWRPEDWILSAVHSDEVKILKQTEEILRDSVRLRLMADVPFGTFLSGGADSGLISALAADISPERINTFNVSFEDAVFDETPFAKKMAQIIGAKHHTIRVSRSEVLQNLDFGLKLVGEPFADSSVFPTMAVSKFAAQHVKMALSGDGGDELFMGYGAYTWADRLNNPFLKTGRKAIAAALRMKGGNRNRRAAHVFDFGSKDSIQSHIFSQEQNFFSATEVQKLSGQSPVQYRPNPNRNRKLTAAEEQAFYDLTHYLKDDLLVKVDRSSMRYGLEVRVPFLDHRLVEYSLNIDPALKRKNGEQKYLIKKIMERYYPKELIYRQKWGFSIPMEKWLKDAEFFSEINTPNTTFNTTYESLNNRHSKNSDESYLYNRLYALKCLAAFM